MNMEKKRYSTPFVEEVILCYPLMHAMSGSDVPGDVQPAPARRFGEGKAEVF